MPVRRLPQHCLCDSRRCRHGAGNQQEREMTPFRFQRAATLNDAIAAAASGAKFLAGGTNLVDLMKGGVERPETLIDITRLDLTSMSISPTGTTVIEAGVRNRAVANHPIIRSRYP